MRTRILMLGLVAIAAFLLHCSSNTFNLFNCGNSSCDTTSQYCDTTPLSSTCQQMPQNCTPDPSCGCVLQTVGPQCCVKEGDGTVHVDLTGKACL